MSEDSLRIALLPQHVRTKILSSYQISSPESVIEGLVRNSLDANAQSLYIEADFTRGFVLVRDDGTGIKGVEFSQNGRLAQPDCMAKAHLHFRTALT